MGSRRLRIAIGGGIGVFVLIAIASLVSGKLPAALEVLGALPCDLGEDAAHLLAVEEDVVRPLERGRDAARDVERIEVRGGVQPVLKGVRTFYIDDPDGNEVEVIAPL